MAPPLSSRIQTEYPMNTRYFSLSRSLFFFSILMLLASCASSNGMVRKCNGKRGTRVAMGVL